MPHITRRASAIAGLVLGPLWLSVVALLTWAEWGYMHSIGWTFVYSNDVAYPSATATGPYGLVQTVNFALAGALAAIFLVGFRREFRARWAGRVATFGLGLFALAGALNSCTTDLGGGEHSWHGITHGIGFFMTMIGLLVGISASGLALRGNPAWHGWRWFCWTPAILLVIAFTSLGMPGDTSWYVFLVVGFGWFTPMGLRLLQLLREPRSEGVDAGRTVPSAASPGLL